MSNKGVKQSTIDKYLGKVFKTNNCGDVVVIEVLERSYCLVKFLKTGNLMEVANKCLLNGRIKDNGNTYRKAIAPTNTKEYRTWNGMMTRCYNETTKNKYPTYKDCTVSENFKAYSYFYDWCNNQTGFGNEGWHLDKDILVKGNKMYSEDTCCFIPPEINCALVTSGSRRGQHPQGVIYNSTKTRYRARIQRGNKWESLGAYDTPEEAFIVYKPIKEAHIKSLANKWKDQIDVRVYDALMNWAIEVTD